ncbi:MAG TPA: dihydroorotase [Chitinophagales bacterium]|nr:dihydroorotase [Chitinophagales bacterium]
MPTLLIRAATILDPNSPFHLQTKDILIDGGIIRSVKHRIDSKDAEEFDAEGKFLSPGWFDMFANFCDPGFEYKEDIESGAKAAAAGGFTGVALMPDTFPVTDSKAGVQYIINKAKGNIVDIFPIGAVTKNCEGKELAEIYDMHEAGAIAFSDAPKPIMVAGLMMRGLLYVKKINGVIISHPHDETIAPGGMMNEGVSSVFLGMSGIPALAEDLMVVRDIELAEYTGSRIHFSCISTKEAVDRIREAKKKGIPVTAGVNPIHLILDDSELNDYDSNYKIFPPLRTKEDIEALKKGLEDGTVDVICSAHQPQNDESKNVEFEYAAAGIINLQTCFALANEALEGRMKPEQLVEKISIAPRRILGLPVPSLQENSEANFTIFDSEVQWELKREDSQSKSVNTPFIGKKFKGKPVAIINHNQIKFF